MKGIEKYLILSQATAKLFLSKPMMSQIQNGRHFKNVTTDFIIS